MLILLLINSLSEHFKLSSKSVGSIAHFSIMEIEVYSQLDTTVQTFFPNSGIYLNVILFLLTDEETNLISVKPE